MKNSITFSSSIFSFVYFLDLIFSSTFSFFFFFKLKVIVKVEKVENLEKLAIKEELKSAK
jgi:hypothetical protein